MPIVDVVDNPIVPGTYAEFVGVGVRLTRAQRFFLLSQMWDIAPWDGFYIPRTGAFILRVPADLHVINSGSLAAEDIFGISTRHVAGGVYPLVHYTAHQPVITSISANSGVISLQWTRHPDGTVYDIYATLKDPDIYPDTQWVVVASGIAEQYPATNSGSFQALSSGVTNFVYVKARATDNKNTMPSAYGIIKYQDIYVPEE